MVGFGRIWSDLVRFGQIGEVEVHLPSLKPMNGALSDHFVSTGARLGAQSTDFYKGKWSADFAAFSGVVPPGPNATPPKPLEPRAVWGKMQDLEFVIASSGFSGSTGSGVITRPCLDTRQESE